MTSLVLLTIAAATLAVPGGAASMPAAKTRGLRRYGLALLAGAACGSTVLLLSGTSLPGIVAAPLLGGAAAVGTHLVSVRARARAQRVAPLQLAASFDLLAACLRSGLGVPRAITVVAEALPERVAGVLHRTAGLLALGAPPEQAWQPALSLPATEALARGAIRSARSGTALAEVAASLAERTRAEAGDLAKAAAERSGVLVSGPLGCCFLPAFLVLGVVPVVIGLTHTMFDH